MYAILQRGVVTGYGWIPKWWAPNIRSSVVPQYVVPPIGRFWRKCKRINCLF